jgi:uncharacterized protein (TIGR02271 family)
MVVGKREVNNGGVLIRTVVQTENVSKPVELSREEYVIERISVADAAAMNPENAFRGREIYIPLTREEAFTTKHALLSEKVQIGKRTETERQTVSSPVRSEDVEVTKLSGKTPAISPQESTVEAAPAPSEPSSLNLLREEILFGKATVDNGGVKLQKVVRTQTASQPVELKREEFTIDRTPVSDATVASADFAPKEIQLALSREEAVVGTRIQSTEMVRVRKQVHTDTQTVSGTIRKENIEIVKLAAGQSAMGGTATQGGTTVISESGKELTLTGNDLCGKCQLHKTASCQNVIQVKGADKTLSYYVVENEVSKNFHENVCKQAKKVTATGSVQDVGGKLELTLSKIALTE